ncbi:unnamed protein product [Sphenostylis stenocarpa]|uniref:Uncharacterized protein n=1 Tax=Sphenostylis stenocarpa TaxID=92480 RepID=A0AA86VM31_9FABA|nr:unnamed protein product [Sphenostylis stenocarpa]
MGRFQNPLIKKLREPPILFRVQRLRLVPVDESSIHSTIMLAEKTNLRVYKASSALLDAGYLTHRLIEVVQHIVVRKIDCGTTRGIFVSLTNKWDTAGKSSLKIDIWRCPS